MPYYGSAQVGHLYFFGSVSQTPQSTVAIVCKSLSFGEELPECRCAKNKTSGGLKKGRVGVLETTRATSPELLPLQTFPKRLNPAEKFHHSTEVSTSNSLHLRSHNNVLHVNITTAALAANRPMDMFSMLPSARQDTTRPQSRLRCAKMLKHYKSCATWHRTANGPNARAIQNEKQNCHVRENWTQSGGINTQCEQELCI